MTSKKSHNVRIESEIDKYRSEGNWKKVIDLADHLKEIYPSNGMSKILYYLFLFNNKKKRKIGNVRDVFFS